MQNKRHSFYIKYVRALINGTAFQPEGPFETFCANLLTMDPDAVPQFPVIVPVDLYCEHSPKCPAVKCCPVGALGFRNGHMKINQRACISCGHCIGACKWGEITERSWLSHVSKQLVLGRENKAKLLALTAPSVACCFEENIEDLLYSAGFAAVESVEYGACKVIEAEAELLRKACTATNNDWFLTSCCAAYRELERIYFPHLEKQRGYMQTPLAVAAQHFKSIYPDHEIVFIGPCIGKKVEVLNNTHIASMLTLEELSCIFEAMDIPYTKRTPLPQEHGLSAGIAGAVAKISGMREVKIHTVNGLDRTALREISEWRTAPPEAQITEVIACRGGCIFGPGNFS